MASLFVHNFDEKQMILVEESRPTLAFTFKQYILTMAFIVV
jgi:hypothetical protein